MRTRRLGVTLAIVVVASACHRGNHDPSYALTARGGTYNDGSGTLGLSVLATLREVETGQAPPDAWTATVRDGGGEVGSATYAPRTGRSYDVWWWPDVALRNDAYVITTSDGTGSADGTFTGIPAPELAQAVPAVASDASFIDWVDVPGAASYGCRIYAIDGTVQLDVVLSAPGCDLSALPPGGYIASILAFSADLPSIGASTDPTPPLPDRFDVSEARVAFVRPDPTAPQLVALVGGGALDTGSSTRTLAVWISLRTPLGTPTASSWPVSVIGPGLPPSAPMTFTYNGGFPRQLTWSYEVPATPGTYWVAAGSSVVATFTLGIPAPLAFVVDATATPGTLGSADVSWTPVDGAQAYLASAWNQGLGTPAASMWVGSPPAHFPSGTFPAGAPYDVYVAATDADMSGATVPNDFAVSESLLLPAGFVAK